MKFDIFVKKLLFWLMQDKAETTLTLCSTTSVKTRCTARWVRKGWAVIRPRSYHPHITISSTLHQGKMNSDSLISFSTLQNLTSLLFYTQSLFCIQVVCNEIWSCQCLRQFHYNFDNVSSHDVRATKSGKLWYTGSTARWCTQVLVWFATWCESLLCSKFFFKQLFSNN